MLKVMNPRSAESAEYAQTLADARESAVPPIKSGNAAIAYKREKPVHRVMCYMALAGKTIKAIAAELECDVVTVSSVLRQPWAKQFMAEEALRIAGGSVEDFFKTEVLNSAKMLIELRDDPTVPKAKRADICNTIIDRCLGKPVQQVKTESKITYADAAVEVSKLDAELKDLRARLGEPGVS